MDDRETMGKTIGKPMGKWENGDLFIGKPSENHGSYTENHISIGIKHVL
jgi:hypothetical protein